MIIVAISYYEDKVHVHDLQNSNPASSEVRPSVRLEA